MSKPCLPMEQCTSMEPCLQREQCIPMEPRLPRECDKKEEDLSGEITGPRGDQQTLNLWYGPNRRGNWYFWTTAQRLTGFPTLGALLTWFGYNAERLHVVVYLEEGTNVLPGQRIPAMSSSGPLASITFTAESSGAYSHTPLPRLVETNARRLRIQDNKGDTLYEVSVPATKTVTMLFTPHILPGPDSGTGTFTVYCIDEKTQGHRIYGQAHPSLEIASQAIFAMGMPGYNTQNVSLLVVPTKHTRMIDLHTSCTWNMITIGAHGFPSNGISTRGARAFSIWGYNQRYGSRATGSHVPPTNHGSKRRRAVVVHGHGNEGQPASPPDKTRGPNARKRRKEAMNANKRM